MTAGDAGLGTPRLQGTRIRLFGGAINLRPLWAALWGAAAEATALRQHAPALAILGSGEFGPIAFNDPAVCRLDDPFDVKLVQLDEACRT